MHVTRIYTGDDGRSHFEDLRIPMNDTEFGRMSGLVKAAGVIFREPAPEGAADFLDYHPAPRRQFVIHLAGRVEIECGSGDTRQFGVGDILLADDTTGQGHISRTLEGPRHSLFVTLPDTLDIAKWRV